MQCTTNRAGSDCAFMGKNGCTFMGGACYQVVEKCEGCARIVENEAGRFCSVYPNPEAKWHKGICNFATHVKAEVKSAGAGKVNPLKAAKRASRGR